MTWRTFHFADGKSDKFWSIELTGASHAVHFGRTGTAGQRQEKAFASEAEAQRSHDRLIREKLAKGYVEAAAPPGEPPLEPGVLPPTWREALHLFGVSNNEIDENAFPESDNMDPEWAFCCLVADSPSGVSTDWRGEQDYSLQVLADAMERMGVRVELDHEPYSWLEVAITAGGATSLYAREMPDEWEDFNGLVFALAEVLPPAVAIYALRPFEDTDGWGHAVLPAADWERVRALLGPAFDRIFTRYPPSEARFGPSERQVTRTWAEWVQGVLADRQGFVESRKSEYEAEQKEVLLLLTRQSDPKHWKKHFTRDTPARHAEFLDSFRSAARLEHAIFPLGRLAELRRARGAVQVLEGSANGWAEYHAGVRTYYWMARLDDWATRSSLRGSSGADRGTAEFLADCLALGEWEMARWMFARILAGAWRGGPSTTTLYPLTLRLCASLEGVPFSRLPATNPLGPYGSIFDSWKKPKALARAITEACDYHVQQARRPGYTEFEFFPISAAPMEILAVLRTRRRLGLPVPEIEHTIFDTPLGRPPEATPTMPDDLLDLLIHTIEEEIGPL